MTPNDKKGYYALLNVPTTASEKEIKSAFWALSKQYHPDANVSSEASDFYLKITEAYAVLGDLEKRKKYDLGLENPKKESRYARRWTFWEIHRYRIIRIYLPLILSFSTLAGVIFQKQIKAFFIPKKQLEVVNYKPLPVFPIRIDLSDKSKLFHITTNKTPVYHGPCLDCGIVTLLADQTTVRLTGIIEESDWVRVMTATGIDVFILKKDLGIGKGSRPLPVSSKITLER